MPYRFSRRLDWTVPENALSELERRLRAGAGIPFDLTETNPTAVELPDEVEEAEALAEALGRPEVGRYAPLPGGSPRSRQLIAQTYAESGSAIAPDALILTSSSSESYGYLLKLLCDPGDVVLMPEPSYPLIDSLARLEGLEAVPYRLEHCGGGRWQTDFGHLDDLLRRLGGRARALAVVTPNNPTGSVLRDEELQALDARCARAGIAIIADEVFSDFVPDRRPGQVRSVAGVGTQSLTFSLGGLSKSCGLPQMKLGWIAVGGPDRLRAEAHGRLEWIADTYLPVGAPIEIALADVLRVGRRRRDSISARIAENRRALSACVVETSPVTALPSEGGWSALLRFPAILDDEAWALDLLEREGVLVHPGYFFDLPGTHGVVSLLPPPRVFAAGVTRVLGRVHHLNQQ